MANVFWIHNNHHVQNLTKVILFGAGSGFVPVYSLLKNMGVEILCLCDNDSGKWNQFKHDIPIEGPDAVKRFDPKTPVVISSNYFREIYDQLVDDYGVETIFWGLTPLTEEVKKRIYERPFTVNTCHDESFKKQWMSRAPVFEAPASDKSQRLKVPSLFFHIIPKTGGRSFQEIVRLSCPDKVSFVNLFCDGKTDLFGDQIPDQNDLIVQHDHLYPLLSSKGYYPKLFTILREPVDRFISEFYFGCCNKQFPEKYIEERFRKKSFEALVTRSDNLNYYCRVFSGNIPQNHMRKYACSPETFEGSDAEADYQAAVDNLEKQFFFIGIFEEYEKMLFAFFDLMGWREIRLVTYHHNKTLFRPGRSEIDKHIQHMLAEKTYYDQKLYRFYKVKFNEMIGSQYGTELTELHYANNPHNYP